MLCRFDSRVATASVPQRSQVRLRYNPYILFSAPYCTVPGDLASHVYSGRRRRSHVSPESRQYKQINKQTRRQASHQAREESTSTPPFEAKLCTDWIPNIFHTIDWLWRSVGLPLKKRHVEINAMFLHDQIRRVPQHYSIGRYLLYRACLEPPHFMDEIMHGERVVWQRSGQCRCCDWSGNPQGWEQFQVYSALQTRNATDATKTRTQHVSSTHITKPVFRWGK